jgi:hypothetical protein
MEVRVIRNRYRPMSVPEKSFVDLFDKGWHSVF